MKLKELESTLGCVRPFSSPNVELEQYPTSAHIASRMLFTAADSFDDIVDKSVGDFGCGGGILAAGASIMGASYVLGLDIDPHVLDVAAGNLDALEVRAPRLVQMIWNNSTSGIANRLTSSWRVST